jgi:hypothetical protein
LREQQFLHLLQRCDGLLVRHGGEVIQKIAKRMAACEVVDERLEGDAGSHEDRCASENLRIDVNDAFVASHVQNRNRICWLFARRSPEDEGRSSFGAGTLQPEFGISAASA